MQNKVNDRKKYQKLAVQLAKSLSICIKKCHETPMKDGIDIKTNTLLNLENIYIDIDLQAENPKINGIKIDDLGVMQIIEKCNIATKYYTNNKVFVSP